MDHKGRLLSIALATAGFTLCGVALAPRLGFGWPFGQGWASVGAGSIGGYLLINSSDIGGARTRPRWAANFMLVFGLPLLGIAVIASVIGVQQLQSVTDPMEKGVAGAVGSLIAGASLFLVRLRYRSVYGLTEVAVGLYLGWDKGAEVVGPLSVASSNRTFLLAMLTASIYLVVRGFDNMHVGWRARSGVAQRPGPSSKLSESTSMNTSTTPSKVLVALTRPPGYADVHPELVAIDALDPDRPWPHEVVRDEGADVVIELYRTEGYERAAARAVATEAVKPEWPAWRVVRS